jgi:putative OPT family oligopeptide transporter
MAVLRLFRKSNILENNIVQTAASSGEALAAGVIFTIPALLLIGYWSSFNYWQTTAIGLVGGVLGVLFTIPLRRALIVGARLRFPEGVATAEVLKVGSSVASGSRSAGFRILLTASILGGVVKLGENGLGMWPEALEGAARIGRTVVYGGMNVSPALLAVGYIIGPSTALVVFLGGALGWLILIPAYGILEGVPEGTTAMAAAKTIWSTHIRYVGIGAMLVGGLWTLAQLRGPVLDGLRRSLEAYRGATLRSGGNQTALPPRTERDAPFLWVLVPLLCSVISMAFLYRGVVGDSFIAVVMAIVMAVAAFLFSAVAAYMAGLVGSSSNPVSGVTIATIALSALLLVLLMGRGHPAGPAAALLIGAVVCCAAAMGGDNLQDLKTGHLVGATPWKQQVMQVVGVLAGAVVIVPVMALLQAKYGIGEITEQHPHPLSAPQATLMASLALGVFGEGLPWDMVAVGAGIGIVVILFDLRQQARGASFRMPVLAVALGIYLPLKLSLAVLAGGMVGHLTRTRSTEPGLANGRGLLCAAGLVTGEALMGIVLAVPVALSGVWPTLSGDSFRLFEAPPLGGWLGVAVLVIVAVMLYRAAAAPSVR